MSSFLQGLLHPVLGLDHLAAMVCVGLVSALMGRTSIWLVPASFVAAMAVGGVGGLFGPAFPGTEAAIAASLVALGGSIASIRGQTSSRPLLMAAVFFVALFGLAHGYAHGREIPANALPWAFTAGFLAGSALLHIAGLLAGTAGRALPAVSSAVRIGGLFVAAFGVGLLTRS